MFKLIKQLASVENNSDICIYGTGGRAKMLTDFIKDTRPDINIVCYLDSFKNGFFEGKKVIKIDEFEQQKISYKNILIASIYYEEIVQRLEQSGLSNYLKEDIEKPITLHYLKQEFCPVCGSSDVKEVWEKRHIKRCQKCSHAYTEFMISLDDIIQKSYRKIDYWYQDRFPGNIVSIKQSKEWDNFVNSRLTVLNKFDFFKDLNPKDSKILELGCSEGMLVKKLIDKGYFAFGCEVNPEIAQMAIFNLGIPIINKPIERIDFNNGTLDAIMSFHVFEHLIDPKNVMEKCSNWLKNGGKFELTVPIDDGEFANGDHFHFFSTQSIVCLMEQFFKNVSYYINTYVTAEKQELKAINIFGVK